METLSANDVSKVILSTLKSPEVAPHSVVLRHAVYDLEKGHTQRALANLDQAADALNLVVFSELSRFLDKQSDSIGAAVNSTAWSRMKETLNGDLVRWQDTTGDQSLRTLLDAAIALRIGQNPSEHQPHEHLKKTSHSREGLRISSVSIEQKNQKLPKLMSPRAERVQDSESLPSPSPRKPQKSEGFDVNYSAAIVTFVFTIFLVMLWWSQR